MKKVSNKIYKNNKFKYNNNQANNRLQLILCKFNLKNNQLFLNKKSNSNASLNNKMLNKLNNRKIKKRKKKRKIKQIITNNSKIQKIKANSNK